MDEMNALRAFRSDDPPASTSAKDAAWIALETRIHAATRTPSRRRRWTAPRRLVPLSVAVVGAVLMMVAGPLLNNGGPASSAAAEELNAVAEVAMKQIPDTASRGTLEGEFLYTRSESLSATLMVNADGGAATGALVPVIREFWIAADGSGRIRQTAGTPTPLGDSDPDLVAQIGGSMNLDQTFLPGELYNSLDQLSTDDAELAHLADDPAALMERLRAIAESHGKPLDASGNEAMSLTDAVDVASGNPVRALDYRVFTLVGDLLRESAAPPALRAALYRVLAGIDGIELRGEAIDEAGRLGIAVAMTHAGVRHELIFDPATSALLGERQVLTETSAEWGNASAGTVIGYVSYLESGVVLATDQTP